MTSTRPTLAATDRAVLGKAVSSLRRDGRLPAVVFGHNVPSLPVSVDAHEFEVLRRRTGPHALVDLSVGNRRPQTVMVHDVQIHPITRRPLHVDLMVLKMTEELTVDVPVVATGTSVAVEKHGGTLVHNLGHVKVRALPDKLPQVLELSIERLVDFDTSLYVRDLVVAPGATILNDPDEPLVHVVPPRIEEAPAAPAAEAEVPEGAEAEAEGAPPGEQATSES